MEEYLKDYMQSEAANVGAKSFITLDLEKCGDLSESMRKRLVLS